jgi:hypothetical protein
MVWCGNFQAMVQNKILKSQIKIFKIGIVGALKSEIGVLTREVCAGRETQIAFSWRSCMLKSSRNHGTTANSDNR